MFKKHRVVYVEELCSSDESCSTHQKPYQYYCHKCDKLLCDSCFVSGIHNDHINQVCEMDDALRGIREAWLTTSEALHSTQARLTTAAMQASEELQSLDRNQESTEERIQLLCEQLRQEVNHRESELLDVLAVEVEGRREGLQEGLGRNEVILERLACCLANGGRILHHKDPGTRLHCKDFIFSEAKQLLMKEKETLVGVERMSFGLESEGHEGLLDQIGAAFSVTTTLLDGPRSPKELPSLSATELATGG